MPTPFDSLAWLASKSTEAFPNPAGQIRLRFGQFVRSEDRKRIRRVIEHWYRLQLDGTRDVAEISLSAFGRREAQDRGGAGRYRIAGKRTCIRATAS